jgi:uncharacterized repeat protein (TIGR01451 family)
MYMLAHLRIPALMLTLALSAGVALAAAPGQEEPPAATPSPTSVADSETATATPEEPTATLPPTETSQPPTETSAPAASPTLPPEPSPSPTSAPPTRTPAAPATPTPDLPPTPTVIITSGGPPTGRVPQDGIFPIGEVPLSLAQRVSAAVAAPGELLQYTIQVSSSRANTVVEVRSTIPSGLTVLGASASSGTCSGTSQISCHLTLGDGRTATIIIQAQVSGQTAAGAILTSQSIAQDNLNFTAATDPVAIQVVAAPASSISGEGSGSVDPGLPQLDAPAPPAQHDRTALPTAPTQIPAPLPAAPIAAEPGAADSGAPAPPDAAMPTEPISAGPSAPGGDAQPGAPIKAQGGSTAPVSPQHAAALLPSTALADPLIGISMGLLGFAILAFGLRRIRRAAVQLNDQQLAPQLAPLVSSLGDLQRQTASAAEAQGQQVSQIQETIDDNS